MDTKQVAEKLVSMLNSGEHREAIVELYADDAVSIEAMPAMPMPGTPRGVMGGTTSGKEMILKESDWFFEANEIHGGDCGEAMVNGDQFIVPMSIDLTPRGGPQAGQRMKMSEYALYRVKDGKITSSAFFYSM